MKTTPTRQLDPTVPRPPSEPRARKDSTSEGRQPHGRAAGRGFFVLALAAALPLTACGPDASDASSSRDVAAAFADGSGAEIAPVPGVAGAGHLDMVDPPSTERPLYHELGELPFGSVRSWSARMHNSGSAPLGIQTIQAACGCLRVTGIDVSDPATGEVTRLRSFDGEKVATIPAGADAEIFAQLLTAYSTPNERKLAQLRLTTDSLTTPYVTFELGFLPKRTFDFAPKEARMLNVPTSHGGSERIKVLTNRSGDPGRVLGIESVPEGITATLTEESFAGESVWFIDVDVAPLSPLRMIRGGIVLRTTDAEGNGDADRLSLPVLIHVVPDVVLEPKLVAFRGFASTAGAEFTGRLSALVPGARLGVLGTRVEAQHPEDFEVEVTPIEPDEEGRSIAWNVRVLLKPGRDPGYVNGRLVFELDEPVGGTEEGTPNDEVRVLLSGQVLEG